ncbi:MAG: ABC-2 transporter permease [Lachnospiraceae bacterium]|nr:ABC-2 transporter permease [Lachnospiraceae bacterium]
MSGLLYKDFLLVRKNIVTGLFLIAGGVLFAIIFILGMNIGNFQEIKELPDVYNLFFKGTIFMVCIGGVCTALTSSSSIEQDYKAEWYRVLYSSPINIWQEIFSRYILAFLVNTIMCAWAGVLIPLVYMAGNENFGLAQMKTVIYCWLVGMLAILIRLPIDIVFSAKTSVVISCFLMGVCLIVFFIWLTCEQEVENIITSVIGWLNWIYDHGIVVVLGVVVTSFVFSYLGKRNRRWA